MPSFLSSPSTRVYPYPFSRAIRNTKARMVSSPAVFLETHVSTGTRGCLALLAGLVVGIAGTGRAGGQPEAKTPEPSPVGRPGGTFCGDPDAAKLITTDIENFWRAYDKATPKDLSEVLERDYLKPGSPGLKDFLRLRITDADTLARTINAFPKYYASIRESTLRVPAMEKRIRASFYALKHLYPDAVFPDVYFVIGRLSSGGTTSSRGLLIGTEMFARTPKTPDAELTEWHKQVLVAVENLPLIVAHELIHFQQKHPLARKSSLLAQSLIEGGADFLGELISGDHINRHLHTYGNEREVALWDEFRKEMDGNKVSGWLYNGSDSKGRPADLGYYVGYKVVESYYARAPDKRKAIKEILTIEDFSKFLKASGYEEKIEKLRGKK